MDPQECDLCHEHFIPTGECCKHYAMCSGCNDREMYFVNDGVCCYCILDGDPHGLDVLIESVKDRPYYELCEIALVPIQVGKFDAITGKPMYSWNGGRCENISCFRRLYITGYYAGIAENAENASGAEP